MIEKLQARIDKLVNDRDEFIKNANNQIIALNGAIEGMTQLLNEEKVSLAAAVPSSGDTAAEDVAFAAQAMSEAAESMKAQA